MTNTITHKRVRLVKAGSGTKLHLSIDYSRNGGESFGVGSRVECGSSNFVPRTISGLEAVSDELTTALDALAQKAANAKVNPADLCAKCAGGPTGKLGERIDAIRTDVPPAPKCGTCGKPSLSATCFECKTAAAEDDARVIAAAKSADVLADDAARPALERLAGSLDDVEAFAVLYTEAQTTLDDTRRELMRRVRAARDAGASEYQLAELVGVQRLTIRAWLGK